jgi:fluoride exporter
VTVVGVALAGAIGAVARFLVDRAVSARSSSVLPVGTICINVAGSFVLGTVVGLAPARLADEPWAVVLAVGFCGAFTTFSTFAVETVRLAATAPRSAARNVGLSVGLGLLAAALGLLLGTSL